VFRAPVDVGPSIEIDLRDGRRPRLDRGSLVIAGGSVAAGLSAYAFQILGGRTLGDTGFAPVASLLSIHSLILAVLLTPVELLTVRRLTLTRGGEPDAHDRRSITVTIALSVVMMVAFVAFTIDRFFAGVPGYLMAGAAVVGAHALFSLGRGALAGHGRYVAYGLVSGGAALARLGLAAWVMARAPAGLNLAWTVAIPPLLILAWRPFPRSQTRVKVPPREGSGALMTSFVLAGAISQAFVLAGPLVAGALEENPSRVPVVVSVVFVTFSLARAPLLVSQNLAARLLAGLTRLVAHHEVDGLRRWSRRLGALGLGMSAMGYLAGALLGPPLIAALFGAAFRPHATFAGLAGAACALAAASALLDQVLVAKGATGKLAGWWTAALALAIAVLALMAGSSQLRVGWAVLAGEAVAFFGVLVAADRALPESPDSGYDLAKRVIDLLGGLSLILLTLPIQLVVWVAVRLDSRGPALFAQARVGKNERLFPMYKFRTMAAGAGDEPLLRHLAEVAAEGYAHPHARAEGPLIYVDHDPRMTRVGRFLRRTSLDELPNLWNVLRGHMSLVGPRPLIPEEVEVLDPEARGRHKVRPGMSGLAQVEGGSEMTFGERAYWDLEYLRRRSLALDLRILWRTPGAALRRST
jgi:lipopolysaccharide/colanic/teichoic acid biosynthesis glycosyltransferase